MDKESALSIARRYIDCLIPGYGITQAYLFGSYSKGKAFDDSDIDIAVVIDDVSDIHAAQVEMMKLRRQVDLRIEPHPFNRSEFYPSDPVVREILLYGIPLIPIAV